MWLRRGPGCWPHAPPRPTTCPSYPRRCAVSALLPSCQHRSREAPFFRGLHRLAVDDRGGRLCFASRGEPDLIPEDIVDLLPGTIETKATIVVMDGSPWRQIMRQHAPRGTATHM